MQLLGVGETLASRWPVAGQRRTGQRITGGQAWLRRDDLNALAVVVAWQAHTTLVTGRKRQLSTSGCRVPGQAVETAGRGRWQRPRPGYVMSEGTAGMVDGVGQGPSVSTTSTAAAMTSYSRKARMEGGIGERWHG